MGIKYIYAYNVSLDLILTLRMYFKVFIKSKGLSGKTAFLQNTLELCMSVEISFVHTPLNTLLSFCLRNASRFA